MKHLLPYLFLLAAIPVLSQQATEPCGTMPVLEEELENDPGLSNRMAEAEDRMQQWIARNKGNRNGQSVITIPVVFHIVHNGEPIGTGPNIADSQVYSQLQIMNEDFRRLNADTVKTRAIFKPFAADPQIEFCLATLAPDGKPTDGINRINGGRSSWPRSDIQDDLKPATVWDSRLYLNFWVVDFGPSSTLLGYAQFPGGNPLRDGIVVGYPYIGKPPYNPVPNSYNYGRTATHEVGHWLNLRHIWGDGPCSDDDFVDDTPLSDDSNYGCPLTENSCTDTPTDYPDMVENYMDYSRDTCMNMFTQGQVDRMRAAINTERSELLTSPACSNAPTFVFDGQVIDSITGQGIPFARVELRGTFSYEAKADTNGYFSIPYLLEDEYEVVAGAWGYFLTVRINDSITTTTNGYQIGLGRGYQDEFALDLGWTVESTSGTGEWTRGEPIGTFSGGQPFNPDVDIAEDYGESCYMTGNGGGGSGNDDVDNGETILRSPYFDLTSYSNPDISFYRWFQVGGGNNPSEDSLLVILTNGIDTDTLDIATRNSPDLGQWSYRRYTITDYMALTDSMQIILHTADRQGSGNLVEAALDFFQVSDSLETVMPPIADFTQEGDSICTGERIRFNNTSTNFPNAIEWHFQGGDPSMTTAVNPLIEYENAGVYDVQLIVGNAGGFDTISLANAVTVFSAPDVTLLEDPILCYGGNEGRVEAQISNGNPPFQYIWDTGDTTRILDSLTVGSYVVTVTDLYGCEGQNGTFLAQPVELRGNASATPDNGSGNGSATANASGGTPPYSFQWNDPNSTTGNQVTGLAAGTYTVTITDGNGCEITRTVEVPLASGIQGSGLFKGVQIVPNPATDRATVKLDYVGDERVDVAVYNVVGQQMTYTTSAASGQVAIELDLKGWSSGWYMVEIRSNREKMVIPFAKTGR